MNRHNSASSNSLASHTTPDEYHNASQSYNSPSNEHSQANADESSYQVDLHTPGAQTSGPFSITDQGDNIDVGSCATCTYDQAHMEGSVDGDPETGEYHPHYDRQRSSAANATHSQSIVYVQTPVLDPMAASAAFADDYWREALSMQTLWSLKLTFMLWIAVALSLFQYARGDALAVQIVSSIALLCMLFYDIRMQSRAAHADKVGLNAAVAWVAYSAFTAFSGRTVDAHPAAYISRDFGLLFAVAMLGVRYWFMNMTIVPVQQHTPLMYMLHRIWSTRSPLIIFCGDHSGGGSSAGYYAPLSPHISGAVQERAESPRWSNVSSAGGSGGSMSRPPYARRPLQSPYISATQRALSLQRANVAHYDPAAKNDERRAYGDVSPQDLVNRIIGGVVALVHEMLYWGFAVGCALPLHNNGLFVESWPLTILRSVLFVVIYMISDSMMDPATDVAAVHVAPTLLVLSSYVLFVSPWMLFTCLVHLAVLGTYVVVHAHSGSLPWSRWACINALRKEYASRFSARHQSLAQDEVDVAAANLGADNAASDDDL